MTGNLHRPGRPRGRVLKPKMPDSFGKTNFPRCRSLTITGSSTTGDRASPLHSPTGAIVRLGGELLRFAGPTRRSAGFVISVVAQLYAGPLLLYLHHRHTTEATKSRRQGCHILLVDHGGDLRRDVDLAR